MHNGGKDFRRVLDNRGRVVAGATPAGTVVARYSYDPYGNAVSVDESGLSNPNIVRYAGGALDQTTGLTKLGQRYYDPAVGGFTQQDADQILANPSNGNLYAYAGDNPINYIDLICPELSGQRIRGQFTLRTAVPGIPRGPAVGS